MFLKKSCMLSAVTGCHVSLSLSAGVGPTFGAEPFLTISLSCWGAFCGVAWCLTRAVTSPLPDDEEAVGFASKLG